MESMAQRAFEEIFGEYELTPKDAAWNVFKAGWDARCKADIEIDLQLGAAYEEIRRLGKMLTSVDPNVDEVREKMRRRAELGLAKYGVTTERTDLDLLAWCQHAQEEAMDLAVYMQRIMKELKA